MEAPGVDPVVDYQSTRFAALSLAASLPSDFSAIAPGEKHPGARYCAYTW